MVSRKKVQRYRDFVRRKIIDYCDMREDTHPLEQWVSAENNLDYIGAKLRRMEFELVLSGRKARGVNDSDKLLMPPELEYLFQTEAEFLLNESHNNLLFFRPNSGSPVRSSK